MRREDFEHVLAAAANVSARWISSHRPGARRRLAVPRERDWDFAGVMLHAGLVGRDELLARVRDLPVDGRTRGHIESMLRAL